MSLRSDCLVIGAGIAGMTAALYLKRSNVNVILIEKSAPGGQINMTSKIENYPGFDSIDGPTLAMNIFNQIKSLGVEYRYGNVIDIVDTGKSKIVKTDMDEIECQVVIIATGRIPKELGLENEKQLTGRGVSWCAVCDGFFYKDKKVAIIGGGNCALEEALFLADIAKKVYLIHRRDQFRAELCLQDKINEKKNIEIIFNSNIIELKEKDNKLSEIILETKGKKESLPVDGLFIHVGFKPNLSFIKNLNIKTEDEYIIVDQNMETNIKNIFACGDVIKKDVYQLTTAVGEGAIAATNAKKRIDNTLNKI
ncbi:MAG: FAD-dependent oxidoreductase [Mollicutes bacterium]|jgi:thioredoxin reductase (NADPH)|nr:FAD-dependent oxidoreductase [Mollicutes bacterium]